MRSKVLGKENPLTNQVRSLHDMVRSIPMPKGISAGGSFDSSPVAVSDITNSVAKSPSIHHNLIQKDRGIANSPSHSVSEELLSIPQLDLPTNNKSAMLPTHDTENQKLMMDGCEATEESCLLRRPADGDLPASQTSDFVTYARVAAVVMENNGSLNGETDRMATIRKAKAVLERNRDFMDSPVQHSTNNDESSLEKTTDERDGNLNEDGLIPLAGDWPGPTDKDKLSTEVLSNPNENLHTIHNCATNYLLTGRQSEAATLLEMVVECQKSKNGNLHEDVGSAVHNVGIAYLRMDENYTALEAFEEAVRVRKEALGREHPQVAVSLVKAGISLMLLQRHEDALWIFREALSVRKLALGDLHPSNARIYNNIGCVHVEFDELEDARKAFESALDIQRNALINNAENLPMIFGASTTLQNLGFLYGKRDMYEKAAMVLRESLSLQERIMYPEHPTVLSTLESLAETCLDAQRFSHALKYYTQLFDRSQSMKSVNSLKQATTLQTIATIYCHLGDNSEQKKKLEMALRIIRSDNDTSDTATVDRVAIEKKIQMDLELI